MKTRMSSVWALGLILVMAFTSGASAQEPVRPSPAAQTEIPAASSPAPQSTIGPSLQSKAPATSAFVSSWLAEVMKLARAGVDDSVMLTFIDSAGTFNLGADQIIELRDLGVGTDMVMAMIDHDYELLSGCRPMPAGAVASSPPQLQFSVSSATTGTPFPSPRPFEGERENPTASTIVASVSRSPGDGSIALQLAANDEEWQPVIYQREAPPVQRGFSPVRVPYAVKLTDPIVMFRGPEPVPNIVVINHFR
ncbi:MAG: hypothetical protein QOJ40_188 [Verrucomicrobiota bacterium]